MQVEHSAGYIHFTFDEVDKIPKLPNGRAVFLAFVDDLKAIIPSRDRDYDPDNYVWTIKDTWAMELQELRNKYFADKNQVEMF